MRNGPYAAAARPVAWLRTQISGTVARGARDSKKKGGSFDPPFAGRWRSEFDQSPVSITVASVRTTNGPPGCTADAANFTASVCISTVAARLAAGLNKEL
jgi:hypothetical protein